MVDQNMKKCTTDYYYYHTRLPKNSTIDTIGPNWGMIGPTYQVKFLTHL